MTSDLGKEKVRVCIKEYPELYRILESSQEDLEVAHGELLPNLAYFKSRARGFSVTCIREESARYAGLKRRT